MVVAEFPISVLSPICVRLLATNLDTLSALVKSQFFKIRIRCLEISEILVWLELSMWKGSLIQHQRSRVDHGFCQRCCGTQGWTMADPRTRSSMGQTRPHFAISDVQEPQGSGFGVHHCAYGPAYQHQGHQLRGAVGNQQCPGFQNHVWVPTLPSPGMGNSGWHLDFQKLMILLCITQRWPLPGRLLRKEVVKRWEV